jgi:predicted TIM-barrel fold metal-dependent hydrolase
MIVDAHCHAWARWPYDPAVPDPARGSAANLLWEMSRAGVSRAVVICAAIGGNDNNIAHVVASEDRRLVPFVDFDCRWHATHHAPGAPGRLATLLAAFPYLRGVNHYMREDADPGWLLSEDGLACLRLLEQRGLVLSLACGAAQAATVARAAAQVPKLTILIHHLFRVRVGDDDALRAATEAANAAPNLILKLSGHGYAQDDGWDVPLPRVQAVVRALTAAFGTNRLVWGSDWPVSTRFMTYRQALEMVRTHGPPFTPDERAAVLGGTMARLLDGARP